MIGYLRGTINHLGADYCFIDVHGVGYRVYISSSTRQALTVNAEVTLLTYLNVREDALLLYGFNTPDEYEMFQLLIAITGIGPKVALGVLSAIRPQEFRAAVSQKNAALLTRIPGIGKKTAERMILELKDKIGSVDAPDDILGKEVLIAARKSDPVQEAVAALMALGYSQGEAAALLAKVNCDEKPAEDLIRLALKETGRR
ncbi:MAG: Holliday junction ATP-dependent helicase ruvA [Firmicutes bacterium]|nr:Holliday junction ATP-dependent helicase ruvA [Bacillota bacterium]